jgi:hypothetical protein
MIQYLIFDLDGVLIDSNSIHRDSFINTWNSINSNYQIDNIFHDTYIDGETSVKKIEFLDNHFGIKSDSKQITMCKKDEIIKILSNFNYSNKIQTIFEQLKADGFSLSCASNNDRNVLELILKKLQIYDLLDSIISKEDVASPKPAADCYLQTMKNLRSLSSTEVLIFEDSDIGIKAAKASGAKVAIVSHPDILTYDFIINAINNSTYP